MARQLEHHVKPRKAKRGCGEGGAPEPILLGHSQLIPGELKPAYTDCPPSREHWVTPGNIWPKSGLPASAPPTLDLSLGWNRLTQQKHVLKEASDVNVSNDRAEEEVPKQAG